MMMLATANVARLRSAAMIPETKIRVRKSCEKKRASRLGVSLEDIKGGMIKRTTTSDTRRAENPRSVRQSRTSLSSNGRLTGPPSEFLVSERDWQLTQSDHAV